MEIQIGVLEDLKGIKWSSKDQKVVEKMVDNEKKNKSKYKL